MTFEIDLAHLDINVQHLVIDYKMPYHMIIGEVSTTLIPKIVCVRHFGPWYLEINSLFAEVAFHRSH